MTHEENLKPNNIATMQTIVLRTKLMPHDIMEILEKKKTSLFGSALRHPKSEDVKVENPVLYLERIIFVSGYYEIDFNRKATYTVKVDSDVREVSIGNEKFHTLDPSGIWKRFGKKMKQGVGITKQDLKINVTENAVKTIDDFLYLDHNGLETNFSHNTSSEDIENYTQRTLDINKEHIRKIEITDGVLFEKLIKKIKDKVTIDVQINHEEYIITEFNEIFVPIYETKCFDNKEKVAIARVDAISGKLL